MRNKVDFFIVGAAKSGTTTLFEILRRHPDVFFPSIKEPCFLATDADFVQRTSNEADYDALYDSSQGKVSGDASAVYFHSQKAAFEIYQRFPHARIIVILRDPCSSFLSLFQHEQAYGDIRERDPQSWFNQLVAQEKKKGGAGKSFLDIYKYHQNLMRITEQFRRDQLLVILLEDFQRDSEAVMKRVYAFLGLRDVEVPTAIVRNAAKAPKLRGLIDGWIFIRKRMPGLAAAIKSITSAELRGRLWNRNLKPADKPELSEGLRRAIIAYYRPEVEGLARFLGRDLDHWLK